jgi:hypothetical protein
MTPSPDRVGLAIEVARDGSAQLVVDGERLFRFENPKQLLDHYALRCADVRVHVAR